MNILVINGPNLNALGKREPDVYGGATLKQINDGLTAYAKKRGCALEFFQSDCEGGIVGRIHAAKADGIIINAGAYTHTSVAIRDALACVDVPKVEVHISNVFKREEFRHKSYLSAVCDGVICGLGADGYRLAIDWIKERGN